MKSLMLWSWDLLNNLSRIAGLTFFGGKITWSLYYRRLLLVLVGTIPRRRLRASRIIALVLGL